MTERFNMISLEKSLNVIIGECNQYVNKTPDEGFEFLDDSMRTDLVSAFNLLKSAREKLKSKM